MIDLVPSSAIAISELTMAIREPAGDELSGDMTERPQRVIVDKVV